jgi:hypothetical protein
VISKIKFKSFQINLMLELFMCVILELLELLFKLLEFLLNFYSFRVILFFFKFVITTFWHFFCCLHFSLNLHYFFIFFPTRIAKLGKFETKKTCWLWGGGEGEGA